MLVGLVQLKHFLNETEIKDNNVFFPSEVHGDYADYSEVEDANGP